MTKDQLDSTRTHAKILIEMQQGMNHDEFVASVTTYAVEQFGDDPMVKRHAGRMGRYVWDSYRKPQQ